MKNENPKVMSPKARRAHSAAKNTAQNSRSIGAIVVCVAMQSGAARAHAAPPVVVVPAISVAPAPATSAAKALPVSHSPAPDRPAIFHAACPAIVLPGTTRLPDPERDRVHELERRVAELEREIELGGVNDCDDRFLISSTLGYPHRIGAGRYHATKAWVKRDACGPEGTDPNATFTGTPHRSAVLRFAADSMPRSTKADATYSRHVLNFARDSGVNVEQSGARKSRRSRDR